MAVIDLTTVTRVKALLNNASTTFDTLFAQLIRFYSARFEKELGRHIETVERTEQYDVEVGRSVVALRAYPVVEVTSVKNDGARRFEGDPLDASVFYVNVDRGLIEFDGVELVPGPGVLRVTYTAGMTDEGATDPTDSFIENYPDLAQAMDLQVAEIYRRKDKLGANNMSFQGGGVGYESAVKLLPEVERTLALHRRYAL